jgi:hypothetical protein
MSKFCEWQFQSLESKTGHLCLEHINEGIIPDCLFETKQEADELSGIPWPSGRCGYDPVVVQEGS